MPHAARRPWSWVIFDVGQSAPMSHLPDDPLTPASKGQTLLVGVMSLIAASAFFVFTALTIQNTSASGRIAQPSIIWLIALMVLIGAGFLDVAFALLRKGGKRRRYLLSSTTLYLVGGFFVAVPVVLVAHSVLTRPDKELWSLLRVMTLS